MKRSLAILLRKLANRLDPPREPLQPLYRTNAASTGDKSYRLSFLP